jgi:hypothetical protein
MTMRFGIPLRTRKFGPAASRNTSAENSALPVAQSRHRTTASAVDSAERSDPADWILANVLSEHRLLLQVVLGHQRPVFLHGGAVEIDWGPLVMR